MIAHRPSAAVSTFNLYKGGSLALYESFRDDLAARLDIVEITFPQSDRPRCDRRLELRYPVRVLNFVYRFAVEQLLVPLIAWARGARRLVMFGNFPSLLWRRPQTVFFHNTLYLEATYAPLRFRIERWGFQALVRLKRPRVLVQTAAVANAFRTVFDGLADVEIVGVPVPIRADDLPARQETRSEDGLGHLIYPAHPYPHKNHAFLARCTPALRNAGFKVILTVNRGDLPATLAFDEDVFECVGPLPRPELLRRCTRCSGMLFPSLNESLGLPLVEAAQLGLPVIAPDLPYVAAAVDGHYSYAADDPDAFARALAQLYADIRDGRPRRPRSHLAIPARDFNDRVLA